MSKSPSRLRRAGLAGLATTALVIGASSYGVTAASADSSFAFDRVAGHNRFATSVEAAKVYGNSANVILANGEAGHYPDALTANYLSGARTAPVLLTKVDTTPTVVTDYLKSSGVKSITIVGGSLAVSGEQEIALRAAGYTVNRIAGTGDDTSRYGTARAVSAAVGGTHDTAVLATGEAFPDAVAAGPLSYVKQFPLTITKTNTLPQATKDALTAAGVKHVIIVGGEMAVSQNVVDELKAMGIDVTFRAAGDNRSDTSVKLASYELADQGFTDTRVNVASGQDELKGADALSGGPVSGKENRAILITKTRDVPGTTLLAFLSDHSATLTGTDNHIFGGPLAVSDFAEAQMEAAARTNNGQITLSSTSVQQGGALTGTITGDNISSVSVTGCGLDNQTLGADDNSTTPGRQFTLNLPSSQQPASCTLTFTITNNDGSITTETENVTVTALPAGVSATSGPELTSVAITQAANPAVPGTGVVTYTFDEAVDGRAANAQDFHLYRFNGTDFNATSVRVSGNQVIASFDSSQLQNITLGTVDFNAVSDVSGQQNPEGAEPVQSVTQAAGVTTAPDLVSVGNFRTDINGILRVDYVFDQAVGSIAGDGSATPDATGFSLVEQGGFVDRGQSATVTGADSRTVTVQFTSGNVDVPQSQISRGVVAQGAVGDAAQTDAFAAGGNTNPLEAADVNNSGNTDDPDLVSARVTGTRTVEYTFDEAVNATGLDGTQFSVYDADTTETPGALATDAVRSQTDSKVVTVTFPTASDVSNAVGANVRTGAVLASDNANPNQADEVGLQQVAFQAGRTTLPDLTAVKVIVDPVSQDRVVRYTFDQDVSGRIAPQGGPADANDFTPGDFFLYDANNARFAADGDSISIRAVSGDDNSVDIVNGFSTSQVNAAVLGTVNDKSADGPPQTNPAFPEGDAPVTR